ncbi:sterile alpha motif domain-containing protein 1 [Boleophthalmus pectinirostris]|uniref:sterile alpha motif domain-containing protein 1 n=1 Tax=Boleophthalmus pectinirostris TaxID=150288 RepID=UPI000A1C6CC0|nr:sterile alpha motif domain-containing protein 1 [Boleophthalmus pectinirostris]
MSGKGPNNYQEWILETIDSLRSRKARPDLERICRMVRRRHGSDPDQTRAELEKLIQSQTVLKVSYKGSISYRNAAKVLRKSRKKSEFAASIDESAKPEHLNNSGDSAQIFPDPDQREAPVGPSECEIPLNSVCDSAAPRCAAHLEDRGTSVTNISSCQQDGCRQPSRVGHTTCTHSVSSTPCGEDDSPGVNCPSNKTCNLPLQRHTLSTKPKLRSANGAPSDRLVASVRSLSVGNADHMKALGLKDVLSYLRCPERLSCEETLTGGKVKVVVERGVERGHLRWTRCRDITLPLGAALEPRVGGKKNDPAQSTSEDERWLDPQEVQMEEDISQSCGECSRSPVAMTMKTEAEDAEVLTASLKHLTKGRPFSDCGTSYLLTPIASPTDSGLDEPGFFSMESLSPMDWSVSDVVSYFSAAGFPEQAAAFRTQEIDGKSLLLMQRSDVLTGLSIKLGPALKIYEHHVKALQKIHFEEEEL